MILKRTVSPDSTLKTTVSAVERKAISMSKIFIYLFKQKYVFVVVVFVEVTNLCLSIDKDHQVGH